MFTTKSSVILLSAIIFSFSSNMAMAAKSSGITASVPGWPLLLFLALVIIFHKKIFSQTEIPSLDSASQNTATPKQKAAEKKAPKAEVKTDKETVSKAEPDTKASHSGAAIDLTDGGKQCQASTTKGTQCKRSNTLGNITIRLDGNTYLLTSCAQHNKVFKPYPKLIK